MDKLFYQDPHMVDFEGVVQECKEDGRGNYSVLLDRTAFFPEQGGQLADRGTLCGQQVLDVRIKDELIWHMVKEPVGTGRRVEGHVDWAGRFDFMQQHSGEHLVSGLVHQIFGYDNVGFHLGLSEVTLDFNGVLNLEQLREIERKANEAIWRDLPVNITFPAPEELNRLDYRSKKELSGDVRIVEIPGIDVCACCAPHVDSTGQIGLLKVTGVQSHRGGVRVNILCGLRALQDYSLRQDCVSKVSVLLSSKPDEIHIAVSRLKEESRLRKERANALQAQLLALSLDALPSPDKLTDPLIFTGPLDTVALRNAVNSLCESYEGYCSIYSGDDLEGYHFIIGSRSRDCRELAASLKSGLDARGGGAKEMIQGSVSRPESEIRTFMNSRNVI